jgi:IclR family KDG regulon transcriptional repressor
MKESENINAISRAFRVIDEIFKSPEPIGVSALAARLMLPKVTTFRILTTLVDCGAIEKDEDDRYRLGIMFIRYGEKVRSDTTLNSLASPILARLRDTTQESVNLGVLYEGYVVNLMSLEGDSFIITSRALPVAPLHCSAMGKLFLAYMDIAEAEAYFAAEHTKRTVHTITTFAEFAAEKQRILSSSVSHDREEYEYGLYCIGAPIFGHAGNLIAAISITGPTSRMKMKGFDLLTEQITSAAAELTHAVSNARL